MQVILSHVFLLNINNLQTNLFDPLIESKQLRHEQVRVDQEVMLMKGYTTLRRSLEL